MENRERRIKKGSALIRSTVFFAIGLACIPLGLGFLPVIGILVGAGLMIFALYPWLNFLHQKKVNVRVEAVTDNNLESMRMTVAVLSATKERDGFDFDPREVDPNSAVFGPNRAAPLDNLANQAAYERSLVDINGDGVPDLLLYFAADTAGIRASDDQACFRARKRNGETIVGCGKIDYGYESGLNESMEYI